MNKPSDKTVKVAALICTRNRPKGLKALVHSLDNLVIPENVAFEVCVADNNSTPEIDGYIREAFEGTGLIWRAEHEPVAGYSSARNRTLKLALESDASFFLVTDDDLLADPQWLAEHLIAFDKYSSHMNSGMQVGGRNSRTEGQVIEDVTKRLGTSNLAFRRLVIDPVGMNIRFDMARNESGGEDTRFALDAQNKGAKIIHAARALVFKNEPDWETQPKAAYGAALNLAEIRRVKQHNEMAAVVRDGRWDKMISRLLKTPISFLYTGLLGLSGWVATPFALQKGLKLRARAYKNWCKFAGTLSGLSGSPASRTAARRDDIDG